MSRLPERPTYEEFLALHREPIQAWRGLLDAIGARHDIDTGSLTRNRLGKNLVFVGDTFVIKVLPWLFLADLPREAAALTTVAGRLPVDTPSVLGHGELDGWGYLITSRLPGRPLYEVWSDLSDGIRSDLARQQVRLQRRIQEIRPTGRPAADLGFDWPGLLALQAMELPLYWSGPEVLRESALDLVERVFRQGPGFSRPAVLLHGDLNHLNLLCTDDDDGVVITGLVDWGDSRLGPAAHDLISPAVNQFLRDPVARAAWAEELRLTAADVLEATARAMLYYPDEWTRISAELGLPDAVQWTAVGTALLSTPTA